jgi:hypothetical protein
MELLKTCARWVAFLPVAFVAAWLAWILSKFFNTMYTGGIWLLPNFVERGAIEALASGVMGAAFVYAGAITAPAHRTKVAYFLSALGLAIMGTSVYFAVLVSNYWAIWGAAWAILGLVAITAAAATGELQLSK